MKLILSPKKRGSSVTCLDGAAACLVQEGDRVIIKVVVLDASNTIVEMLGVEPEATIL